MRAALAAPLVAAVLFGGCAAPVYPVPTTVVTPGMPNPEVALQQSMQHVDAEMAELGLRCDLLADHALFRRHDPVRPTLRHRFDLAITGQIVANSHLHLCAIPAATIDLGQHGQPRRRRRLDAIFRRIAVGCCAARRPGNREYWPNDRCGRGGRCGRLCRRSRPQRSRPPPRQAPCALPPRSGDAGSPRSAPNRQHRPWRRPCESGCSAIASFWSRIKSRQARDTTCSTSTSSGGDIGAPGGQAQLQPGQTGGVGSSFPRRPRAWCSLLGGNRCRRWRGGRRRQRRAGATGTSSRSAQVPAPPRSLLWVLRARTLGWPPCAPPQTLSRSLWPVGAGG